MTSTDTAAETGPVADIVHLNLHWLVSAQALARTDAQKAALVYGLDEELMRLLRSAPFPVLRALAESGVLLFRPRFQSQFLKEHLATPSSALAFDLQAWLLAAEEAQHS